MSPISLLLQDTFFSYLEENYSVDGALSGGGGGGGIAMFLSTSSSAVKVLVWLRFGWRQYYKIFVVVFPHFPPFASKVIRQPAGSRLTFSFLFPVKGLTPALTRRRNDRALISLTPFVLLIRLGRFHQIADEECERLQCKKCGGPGMFSQRWCRS